jgi:hypothetical protein
MATDYDAPRRDEVDLGEDSLEELKSRRTETMEAGGAASPRQFDRRDGRAGFAYDL